MFEFIDRRRVKADARALARDAQVPARNFFALYFAAVAVINLCDWLGASQEGQTLLSNPVQLFISIFSSLLLWILGAGATLYCMSVRRGERAEYLVLFDGFSFAGKLILLRLLQSLFIFLWMLVFIFPGFIAAYRYRFAPLNLYENPSLSPLEALDLSKQQTRGYKNQLFLLDLSYFGWEMLATLPTVYVTAASSLAEVGVTLPGPHESSFALFLLEMVFLVTVSIFYRPAYQITELMYFETAIRTSGCDPNQLPQKDADEDESSFF